MVAVSLIGMLVSLVPTIASILAIIWIYGIKKNSDEQVKQNQEMLTLLKRINGNLVLNQNKDI